MLENKNRPTMYASVPAYGLHQISTLELPVALSTIKGLDKELKYKLNSNDYKDYLYVVGCISSWEKFFSQEFEFWYKQSDLDKLKETDKQEKKDMAQPHWVEQEDESDFDIVAKPTYFLVGKEDDGLTYYPVKTKKKKNGTIKLRSKIFSLKLEGVNTSPSFILNDLPVVLGAEWGIFTYTTGYAVQFENVKGKDFYFVQKDNNGFWRLSKLDGNNRLYGDYYDSVFDKNFLRDEAFKKLAKKNFDKRVKVLDTFY